MAKYLFRANYVGKGVEGLLKEGGTSRRDTVAKAISAAGGKLESFYYAFGDTDLYIIGDFPDHATVAAVILTVTATGTVTCKTTVLLTPEELDKAAKKTPTYSPPGQLGGVDFKL